MTTTTKQTKRRKFKAETQQVLDILIHSLYTEREIFLRELISNASDALNRFKLESLTQGEVVDPSAELGIWLEADPETNTLTVRDTGIGMTQEEMAENLGTIARSGAKEFIRALQEAEKAEAAKEVIGQFGVGFYSVFMVAEEVTVESRSYRPEDDAALWRSQGEGSYELGPSGKTERGTTITVKLNEEAKEFTERYRLRQIVKRHSDFVPFPIYIKETVEKDGKKTQAFKQANQRTALWREMPKDVEEAQYKAFYQQLTFDFQDPIKTVHFAADMPLQFYALLFVPSRRDYRVFQSETDYGLKLYARKVLIKERFSELLPPYLRFIEGVVDSEDLPLNVSRESVQVSPIIQKIKTALIGRVASDLKRLAEADKKAYQRFFKEFGPFLKEGIATGAEGHERFTELLRFPSSMAEGEDAWVSLDDYLARMKPEQKEIYYLLGDDLSVVSKSAHLEYFKKHDLEVLYLTDPMDSFMLMGLSAYQEKPLKNIDDADLALPEDDAPDEQDDAAEGDEAIKKLIAKFKEVLGEGVEDVRESKVLSDHACRLVNPSKSGTTSFQRVQRMMGKDYQVPKKILEVNRKSALIQNLAQRFDHNPQDPVVPILIEQLYENELLMEGIHPNPAEMIPRIQQLMAEASKNG